MLSVIGVIFNNLTNGEISEEKPRVDISMKCVWIGRSPAAKEPDVGRFMYLLTL